MDVNMEAIESYFGQYGWSYERLDDTHFATGFHSDVAEAFSVYVTLTPNWVYFAVAPFVAAPSDPACATKLHKHLLRLCHELNLVKFCLEADGDVVMTVELSRANLDYDEFADALTALSYYAEDVYPAVHALATDPAAVSPYAREQELDWGE